MKKILPTILLILIFLIGLSLLLYPTLSNAWNRLHQSKAIIDYSAMVEELDDTDYEEYLSLARQYNASLLGKADRYILSDDEQKEYMSLLNITGSGLMGYIEIPRINVEIAIFHTVDNDILQFAAGHFPGTSLPVGGIGSHSVISGHRGLPSARLFSDLNQLQVGDLFLINVLKETFTYEVDQILTVLPENIEALGIDPREDYFTLVTCTPYGVNTHRLLVRGHRIDNIEEVKKVYFTSEAIQIEPIIVAPVVSIPILILLMIVMLVDGHKRKKYPKVHKE